MRTSYGTRLMDKPEGMLRPVKFTNMVLLDTPTGDGRLLKSAGGGVRELPLTIYAGFTENQHEGAVVAGRVDAVEFDDDAKTVSGFGWLLDDDNGRTAARYLATKSLRHNSVRLTELKYTIDWGEELEDEITITFEEWKIGSTTLLGVPGFGNSTIELDDELTAAIYSSTELLEVDCEGSDLDLVVGTDEITASGADKVPWEAFYIPEADVPTGQKIQLGERREDGWIPVFGHLGTWNSCHDGVIGRCLRIPTPPDNYASFNQPGLLSERGTVETGPIFFKYGHPDRPLGDRDVAQAYGGVENGWCDVRVTPGKHGPWLSGVVRPGVTDDVLHVARASRISGHWMPDGRLKAIVSVNCEGFNVPGSGFSASYDDKGNLLELVASLVPSCDSEPDPELQEGSVEEADDFKIQAEAMLMLLDLEDDQA